MKVTFIFPEPKNEEERMRWKQNLNMAFDILFNETDKRIAQQKNNNLPASFEDQ